MPYNATTTEEVERSFRQMKVTTLTVFYQEESGGDKHYASIPVSPEYQEVLNDARQCLEEHLPANLSLYKIDLKHEIGQGRWAIVHPRAFADLVDSHKAEELEFMLSVRPVRSSESTPNNNRGLNNTPTLDSAPPDYSTAVSQPTATGPSTQVIDTPIIPIRSHEHQAFCDRCNSRIFTIRYKCMVCDDFDYCAICIGFAPLEHGHRFGAIINNGTWLYRPQDAQYDNNPNHPPETPRGTGNEPIHDVFCDICTTTPIVGTRFKCAECPDWDVCQNCLERSYHIHPEHTFIRVTQKGVLMPRTSKPTRFVRTGHSCGLCSKGIIGPTYFRCCVRGCRVDYICANCESAPLRREVALCKHPAVKYYV